MCSPVFPFLSFPFSSASVHFSGLFPRTILSVHLPRILCGFSFLVVLPDVIRLSSVPAPHCPVPASSASGLLSLFSPPCPVRATSAGAFSIATCGAISLFCCLPPVCVLFHFFASCSRFFCCLPPVCVLFCSFMSHVMRLLILAVYVSSCLSLSSFLPVFPSRLSLSPL